MVQMNADGAASTEVHAGALAAVDTIRATARWLIGAFAAIGGVLVAGTQLSAVGSLSVSSPRLWIAAGGFALALLGVGGVINAAVAVLTPTHTNLAMLAGAAQRHDPRDELSAVVDFIHRNPAFFYGYAANVVDLQKEYLAAIQRQHDAFEEYWGSLNAQGPASPQRRGRLLRRASPEVDGSNAKEAEAKLASLRLESLERYIKYLTDVAHYERIQRRFHKRRSSMAAYAILAALGIAVFTWAANPGPRGEGSGAGAQMPAAEASWEVLWSDPKSRRPGGLLVGVGGLRLLRRAGGVEGAATDRDLGAMSTRLSRGRSTPAKEQVVAVG